MNPDQYDKANYNYLANYVQGTKGDAAEITLLMNATMAQFLQRVKVNINVTASENDGCVSGGDILRVMIAELRQCTIDLQSLLNNDKEVLQ